MKNSYSSLSIRKSKPQAEEIAENETTRDPEWLCRGPHLMVCHGKEKISQLTLYNASQKMHYTKGSSEFANKLLCGSHGEWVLAFNIKNASDCCILNAVTMEKIQMPTLGEYEISLFDNFLLSGSPDIANSANSCTVFVMNSTSIFYCKIGESEFTKQDLDTYFSPLCRSITIFQGQMYYIDTISYKLSCAQLKDSSSLQFDECIDGYELEDQLLFEQHCYHYLFECSNQLLYVHGRSLEMGVMDFQVFRADLSEKVWEEIHDIGSDCAIFIDEFRGFSSHVPPECLLKGNCIYYTSDLDYDEVDCNINLFSYDLEDGFVTVLPPFPFKFHRGKSETLQKIWINCSTPN